MNSISISDLRQKVADLVDQVTTDLEPLVIMKRSQPKAVLVDHDYFTSLEDAVIDLADSKEAEKAKKEPKLPLSDYLDKRWPKK